MTRIADLLGKGRTYSFEFFPPKSDAEQATLVRTLRDLEPLGPSFVSVTYRGGAESRQRTFDLVTGMLRTTTLVPMAHLICVCLLYTSIHVDPVDGLSLEAARSWVDRANLDEVARDQAAELLVKLYTCYTEGDCDLAEINPLILTPEDKRCV